MLRAKRYLIVVFLLALMPACEFSASIGGNDIDTAQLEEEIGNWLADLDDPADSVECPDDIEAEEGGTFECTARGTINGPLLIEVTQTNDDGDVEWEVIATGEG